MVQYLNISISIDETRLLWNCVLLLQCRASLILRRELSFRVPEEICARPPLFGSSPPSEEVHVSSGQSQTRAIYLGKFLNGNRFKPL